MVLLVDKKGSKASLVTDYQDSIASQSTSKDDAESHDRLDFEELNKDSLENRARQIQNQEAEQRIFIKDKAMGFALGAIFSMHFLLFVAFCLHASLSTYNYSIFFFITPVVSITTITVVLLIGAFRRFRLRTY